MSVTTDECLRKNVTFAGFLRCTLIDAGLIRVGTYADGRQLLEQVSTFTFHSPKPRKIGDDAVIRLADGMRVHVRLLKGSDGRRWLVALP